MLPRLGVAGDFSFLVDTGADGTLVMPADGLTMGLDYSRLERPMRSFGVGGVSDNFREVAWIVFSDGEQLFAYNLEVAVHAFSDEMMRAPTLLGRDVLNNWAVHLDRQNDRLECEVRTATVAIPASGHPGFRPSSFRQ